MTQDITLTEENYSIKDFTLSIDNNHLQLLYQPIVSLKNNKIYYVEALIYLCHPSLGNVYTERLFSIAKKNNFSYELDNLVLEMACTQIASWKKNLPDLKKIKIKLSGESRSLHYITENISSILHNTKCQGDWIIIQLSENIVMNASDMDLFNISKLKKHGISFSIDEFAASNISFIKLENFQAFSVKIHHKSLSNLIPSGKSAKQKLFRSIEALSHDFNLLLIVHEIESKEQERMFKNYKYDFAQGDYYSKPVPDVKFAQLFDRLPLCRLVK